MKKENLNGNRNRSTRSKTCRKEISTKTAQEVLHEKQIEFLRAKANKIARGHPLAANRGPIQQRIFNSGNLGQVETHSAENQEGKRESLSVLPDRRLFDEIGERSQSEWQRIFNRPRSKEQESLIRKKIGVYKQLRRAKMTPEQKKLRRACFRILGGIWGNRNGKFDIDRGTSHAKA